MPSNIIDMSSSLSVFLEKRDPMGSHFKWENIKTFIFLSCTFSNAVYNFDIFSNVCNKIRIFDFICVQVLVGAPYMFFDFFIQLYTKRVDAYKLLNPLLRGVIFGLLLQTAFMMIVHANFVADGITYFLTSFEIVPSWAKCAKKTLNTTCISSTELMYKCQYYNQSIKFTSTSAHMHYVKSFWTLDRSLVTSRMFLVGVVWICNFLLSTISDETLIKVFKTVFLIRTYSTIIILSSFFVSTTYTDCLKSFQDIFDVRGELSLIESAKHVGFIYGVGFLGMHDFTSVSVFTVVDNAVIMFTLVFTTMALLRSWIIMLTLIMTRILLSEFRSVKMVYLVGFACSIGFVISLPMIMIRPSDYRLQGVKTGLFFSVLYLGGLKSAIVMWIYGVKRFCTDVHFWLGFKPTKFWQICWTVLPIILWSFLLKCVYCMFQLHIQEFVYGIVGWFVFTAIVVAYFHFKTFAKFLVINNIMNVLSANKKYGPPEPEDRKRRKYFDDTLQLRLCTHNCHAYDELIDCDHVAVAQTESDTFTEERIDSLTNIFTREDSLLNIKH